MKPQALKKIFFGSKSSSGTFDNSFLVTRMNTNQKKYSFYFRLGQNYKEKAMQMSEMQMQTQN